jgi:hypothetical protein
MSKLQFKTSSTLNSKTLIEHIMDFEYYSKYFPLQIKEVKIIEKKEKEIITEEKIVFKTLVKNVIEQKSLHKKISENELITEIFEGPAKGTIVNMFCNDVSSGSEITINVDLKLSLKATFLKPFIKKFYQKYLTALILKITNRVESL